MFNSPYFYLETNFLVKEQRPLQLAYINLLICEQGHAHFSINFHTYTLNKGEMLFAADDAIVRLLSRSENFMVSAYFLKRSFAAEVAYELPNPLFSYLHHHPIIRPSHDLKPLLISWNLQSQFILQQAPKYQRIILKNQLQNLFLTMVNLITQEKITQKQKQSRQEQLCWRFWDLIGKYAKSERSVKFYAGKLAITPYYLAKICQEILNDAPKTLIDRQVILEIKRLLTNSTDSLERIAETLHFSDPSYLSRYFKKHTQKTLSEFRQQDQQQITN